MDPIQFPEDLAGLSAEQLAQLATDARAQLATLLALGDRATPADAVEAQRVFDGIQVVEAQVKARAEAPRQLAAVGAALNAFDTAPPAEPEAAPEGEGTGEAAAAVEGEAEAEGTGEGDGDSSGDAGEGASGEAGAAPVALNGDALNGQRPKGGVAVVVRPETKMLAAANVTGFGVGAEMTSLQLAEALLDKFEHYPRPSGKSKEFGTDLHTHALAAIDRGIPDDLVITDGMNAAQIQEVFDRAASEKRLRGGSLVAAGGWCAPSPVDYGLADDGSTTALLWDAPTVALGRGGLRFTLGPDFADIYALSNFFKMTEAQAIAGSFTKPCFTVTCPSFTDHRLDAYGYCFQIPFLTEAGYPEIIRRYLSGSMTAYVHKMDIEKITQLLALLPAAETAPDWHATSFSLGDALRFYIDRERTKRRWDPNQAVQVDLPMWVKGAIKNDISKRMGRPTAQVSDAEVNDIFTSANAAVSWLYNFQPLANNATNYPTTFDMLIYKAGTFVVGTTSVVNLSSVYDAASLAQNIYTGAFFEEGMTVMRRGFGGIRVTVPVCNAGRTGVNDITCV